MRNYLTWAWYFPAWLSDESSQPKLELIIQAHLENKTQFFILNQAQLVPTLIAKYYKSYLNGKYNEVARNHDTWYIL